MARNAKTRVAAYHVKTYGEEDGHALGQPWKHLEDLSAEEALDNNVAVATFNRVLEYLGYSEYNDFLMESLSKKSTSFASALTSAVLPFSRRVRGHEVETLMTSSITDIVTLTSFDRVRQVKLLQDIGFIFQKEINHIDPYDRMKYPTSDDILATVLPASLSQLR